MYSVPVMTDPHPAVRLLHLIGTLHEYIAKREALTQIRFYAQRGILCQLLPFAVALPNSMPHLFLLEFVTQKNLKPYPKGPPLN